MNPINVTLNTGSTLPFRPTTSKHGNTFWGVLGTKSDGSKYYRKFGVRCASSVVGGRLPVKANVLGQTFSSAVLKDEQGRAFVKFEGTVNVDGTAKAFSLTIKALSEKAVNVTGAIRGIGGNTALVEEL